MKISDKLYDVIYADPAWVYKDKSKSHGGGAEQHYICTPTDEMCKFEIPAKKDSVCLMWVTYPMLPDGLKLLESWGFKFKTVAFTWVKTNKNGSVYMGMGRHTRANAEICILGTRGKGLKRQNASIYNTQLHVRGKHSAKPDAFRKDIEKLYGKCDRLEMFARIKQDGWDAWGNEVNTEQTLAKFKEIKGE